MMDHDQAAYNAAISKREAEMEKCRQAGAGLAGNCMAAREMTAGEHLDRQIDTAQRHLDALRDLKASLPGSYLNSGAGRITALLARLTVG